MKTTTICVQPAACCCIVCGQDIFRLWRGWVWTTSKSKWKMRQDDDKKLQDSFAGWKNFAVPVFTHKLTEPSGHTKSNVLRPSGPVHPDPAFSVLPPPSSFSSPSSLLSPLPLCWAVCNWDSGPQMDMPWMLAPTSWLHVQLSVEPETREESHGFKAPALLRQLEQSSALRSENGPQSDGGNCKFHARGPLPFVMLRQPRRFSQPKLVSN